jgi:carboxylesterase type B
MASDSREEFSHLTEDKPPFVRKCPRNVQGENRSPALAKTDQVVHKGLPSWPAFTPRERATMIYNTLEAKVVNDPNRDERLALASVRKA